MHLFRSGKDLAERISALLSIPVLHGDGLPIHAFRSCVRQVLAIETKLVHLRATAKSSYDRLCDTVGSRKRPKNMYVMDFLPLQPPPRRHNKKHHEKNLSFSHV